MRLGLALRAFWKALFDRAAAERMALALDSAAETPAALPDPSKQVSDVSEKARPTPTPSAPTQNPAITLLATLQRDARLIDLIHEDLDQYQDAQVGAAARPCLKQCRQSLERVLKVTKLVDASESDSVSIPPGSSATRYRWIGEAAAEEGGSAKLIHPGWQAASIELPQWNGVAEDAMVIAPAQVSR